MLYSGRGRTMTQLEMSSDNRNWAYVCRVSLQMCAWQSGSNLQGFKDDLRWILINHTLGIPPLSGLIQHIELKPICQRDMYCCWLQATTDSPLLPVFFGFQNIHGAIIQLHSSTFIDHHQSCLKQLCIRDEIAGGNCPSLIMGPAWVRLMVVGGLEERGSVIKLYRWFIQREGCGWEFDNIAEMKLNCKCWL